jgi:hypothetical protein
VLDEYETRVAGTDRVDRSTVLPLEIPVEWGGSPAGTKIRDSNVIMRNTCCVHYIHQGMKQGNGFTIVM